LQFSFLLKITIAVSQKHSTVTSLTQISVIQSQNQQQSSVTIQQLFQHSSRIERSPADFVCISGVENVVSL